MEYILAQIGKMLFFFRFVMSAFYIGLLLVMCTILWKFSYEVFTLVSPAKITSMTKIDLVIKVLELVDMTMVAQLVWVVVLAGYSLFVTATHFNESDIQKPDWLDHVNTYNLKLKLAFAVISISGVHALKNYLQGGNSVDIITIAGVHLVFVLCTVGIAFVERLTHTKR